MGIKTFLLSILLSVFAIQLVAHKKSDWADSLLTILNNESNKRNFIARELGDTLLQIYSQRKDDCHWIQTKLYIVDYKKRLADYKGALKCLNEAQSKYNPKLCEMTALLPNIHLSFASLYLAMQENEKADAYIDKGIKSWQTKWADKELLIRLYMLKGSRQTDFKQMIAYYELGYKISLETNNQKMQEIVLVDIATGYIDAEENSKALVYLKRALVLALKRNSYITLTSIYNNLAGIASSNKMMAFYLDSSIYFASLSGELEDLQTGRQNRALLYYMNGDYKKGYDELWESKVLNDSLFNINKTNAFADMEQKYETEKKNLQIKQLESDKLNADLKASRNLAVDIGMGTALLGIILLAATFYSQKKKKQKLNNQLSIEKKKSDDLLLNILPEEVAEELKQNGHSDAKLYNNVTVLFTDFVNFTGISQNLTPIELVGEIHKNFLEFDAIMEKNGLEKIKTIGDAYMAVCGLPSESPDHALRVVRAALDILQFLKEGNTKFNVRIGIHSGSVVAGIVGVKKYAYDIWGDTVNTASRMESNSEPGKINISESTYELVKDEFTLTYRGKHEVKGKGAMDMYFVESRVA